MQDQESREERLRNVKKLYRIMRPLEELSSSGASSIGIYGTLTSSSFQKVLDFLVQETGLGAQGKKTSFYDAGSGVGRAALHAAVFCSSDLEAVGGIEINEHPFGLSLEHLKNVRARAPELVLPKKIEFVLGNASSSADLKDLEGWTHLYALDKGWSFTDRQMLAQKFNASSTLQIYVSTYKDAIEAGFEVELLTKIVGNLTGSGQRMTLYIYSKSKKVSSSSSSSSETFLNFLSF